MDALDLDEVKEVSQGAFLDHVGEGVRESIDMIRTHLQEELPNECVGLLWGDGQVQKLINQARSPSRFSISQIQLAERLTEMDESNLLICVYHSHPNGDLNLSWDDKRSMRRQWERNIPVPWLIVTVDKVRLWFITREWDFQFREVDVL